jgi:hypothetical protein
MQDDIQKEMSEWGFTGLCIHLMIRTHTQKDQLMQNEAPD